MDTYSLLREFADSWFLIAMFGFFLAAALRVFLPSMRPGLEEATRIPFKDDTKTKCNSCTTCACKINFAQGKDHG